MTAPHLIDPAGMLGQALSQASPDLMRSLLQHVIHALLSADADTVCGAQWGQQDPQRQAQRNGYRYRRACSIVCVSVFLFERIDA